jgi:hypothetical protein
LKTERPSQKTNPNIFHFVKQTDFDRREQNHWLHGNLTGQTSKTAERPPALLFGATQRSWRAGCLQAGATIAAQWAIARPLGTAALSV